MCPPLQNYLSYFLFSSCLFDIIFDMHKYLCCPDDSLKNHKFPRAWKLSRISASNKSWKGFIPQIQLTDNMTFVDPLQFKRVSWWDKGQSFAVRNSFWFWNMSGWTPATLSKVLLTFYNITLKAEGLYKAVFLSPMYINIGKTLECKICFKKIIKVWIRHHTHTSLH